MNVVGDGSAESDIFSARSYGKEEATRHREVEYLCERDACLGGEEAALGIEGDQAVHRGSSNEVTVLEEADVAVAAAEAYGQNAVVQVAGNSRKVALPVERNDIGRVGWVASPGFEPRGGCGGRAGVEGEA